MLAALEIVERDGLDALSVPGLARELDVAAPSLYYHFADKAAIVAAMARHILAATRFPPKPAEPDWVEWIIQLCLNVRTAVLRHRRAAPILLQFMPRDLLLDLYESAAEYLDECGVPVQWQFRALEGLEKVALGAAVAEAMRGPVRSRVRFDGLDPVRHPILFAAHRADRSSPRQSFEFAVRSYVAGVVQALSGPAGTTVQPPPERAR